jgi:hypothetical protein
MRRYAVAGTAVLAVVAFWSATSAFSADPLSIPVYKRSVNLLPPSPCFGYFCTQSLTKRKRTNLPPSLCWGGFCGYSQIR